MRDLEDELHEGRDPESIIRESRKGGRQPQKHFTRFDCQQAGTLKKEREVRRPGTGEKADVMKCTVCGREVYEWHDDHGISAVEHYSPEGRLEFEEGAYY